MRLLAVEGADEWWGRDGTQGIGGPDALAVPAGRSGTATREGRLRAAPCPDALAAPSRSSREPEAPDALAEPGPSADPLAPPALPAPADLPALPAVTDHAATARWMETDAARSRTLSDPPARVEPSPARPPRPGTPGWVDAQTLASGSATAGPARQAGPARLLRPEERPAPAAQGPRRESRGKHPARATPAPRSPTSRPTPRPSPGARPDPDAESVWRRDLREESEFRAQFGEWRAGAPARPSATIGGVGPGTLLILLGLVVFVLLIALG